MQFKNINTYHNQLLGRIAGCQHHAIGIRNNSGQKSIFESPLEFPEWFLKGIRRHESKGFEFEFLNPELVRITVPGQKVKILRTKEDFKREWEAYKVDYYL